MRFMIIRKADQESEAELAPVSDQQLLDDMLKYNEELMNAGMFLGGEGLQPSSKGSRIKFSAGKPTVVDGPFTEAKELIAGFTIIQAKSKAEAIEWAKRWPALDANGEVELEIRQIYEMEDFGPEFTPTMREAEQRMSEQAEKLKRS